MSPDAIVDAIVEELGAGDRRRPRRRRPPPARGALLEADPVAHPPRRADLADLAARWRARGSGRRRGAGRARGRRRARPPPDGRPHRARPGRRPAARPAGDRRRPPGARLPASGLRRPGAGEPRPTRDAAPSSPRCRRPAAPRPATRRPLREGADQRIADRIAGRLRDAYGLRNVARRAAPGQRPDRGRDHRCRAGRRGRGRRSAHRILEAAAVEASAALARVYSLRDAEARATTDALTGLPNRRYFDEYLGLLAKRRRAEDRVGVLMIDIDRFKKLNDTFGHAVGDHVLREVAQAIAGAVREDDVPARFGGEEFAVLLRNPSPEIAVEVGERVRRAVVRRSTCGGWACPASGSRSASPSRRRPTSPLDVVIDEADRALYRAKRAAATGSSPPRSSFAARAPSRRVRRRTPRQCARRARRDASPSVRHAALRRPSGSRPPGRRRPPPRPTSATARRDDRAARPPTAHSPDADDARDARRAAGAPRRPTATSRGSSTRSATSSRSRARSCSRPSPTTAPPTRSPGPRSTSRRRTRRATGGRSRAWARRSATRSSSSRRPGTWPYHERLRAEIPATLVDLLRIPGVGPKTVRVVYEGLGIATLDGPAQGGRGGPRCAASRASPRAPSSGSSRASTSSSPARSGCCSTGRRRSRDDLVAQLEGTAGVTRIVQAGSLRRRRETIGDLDLLVETDDPDAVDRALHRPRRRRPGARRGARRRRPSRCCAGPRST